MHISNTFPILIWLHLAKPKNNLVPIPMFIPNSGYFCRVTEYRNTFKIKLIIFSLSLKDKKQLFKHF